MNKKIRTYLILLLFTGVLSCSQSPIDTEPEINLNALESPGDPCLMCASGGGGDGGGPPVTYNHFMYFMKGKNSSNINHATSVNAPDQWQSNGGTPSQWQTNNGPAAVYFNQKVYLFHISNSSSKVIQSHADITSSGGLSWQTNNSNIELGNGAKTDEPLSATVWNGRIFVASKSQNNDAIYVSRSLQNNGTQWEPTAEQAVTESENDGGSEDIFPFDDVDGWPPYLTVFNNKLYVFWVKRTTNSVFYKVKETLNGSWSARVEVTGIQHGNRREANYGVAATEHNGKLYIAYASKLNNSILTRQVLPAAPGIENMTSLSQSDTDLRPTMSSDGTNLVVVYHDDNQSNDKIYYAYMNSSNTWITNQEAVGESKKPPYLINFSH